ncbi:DUF3592 domain-containing protein [Amycolatopsis sp., V23-08]|uniref:DUF3592 domain-containing protein n=1 Tax=Amycolatopsis heterodermiae TaxID=3110235 RepID=A0ABU5RHW1_9PSEU|nr:DUF3592 domain-containing protein [Amycolatopsis sp., V23-08]MEA5364731.1 DUF3592 domain-containing protein [Amycolatopsis sp., V23-08]
MGLGLSRGRVAWLLTGALGALAFVVFVVGTSVSLAEPGYRFDDGELAADFGVLAGSAALVALAALRIRVGDRRAVTVLARQDFRPWLPPRDDHDGEDLQEETRRLRSLGRRAFVIALFWAGVLAGCAVGLELVGYSADALLATGARTGGEVQRVVDPRSGDGAPSMWVRYVAGDTALTEEIVRDTDRRYRPGEKVTVVYDRDDPARVRTVEERNENQDGVGFLVVPLLLAFVGLPWSLVAAGGWARRYRAVRATGWRAASVTVVPDYPVRRGRHAPDIHVRYPGGTGLTLRAASSTHGATSLKDRPERRAWVGGWGSAMVVLVPRGPRRYAVPAFAKTTR